MVGIIGCVYNTANMNDDVQYIIQPKIDETEE
jgi:hypothetical protein